MTVISSANARSAGDRPNIIYIIADDLGYNELGCYGQKIIKTPNIDRIATEGIKFTQHYSGQAVCAPARCSLMTGYHMGHAFIRDNSNPPTRMPAYKKDGIFPGQTAIPDETITIPELLKQKNYATAAYGKWGLGYEGSSGDPLKQGFDDFGGFLCQIHAHNHYPEYLWKNGKKITLPGNDRTLKGKSYSQDYFVNWGLDFIRENKEKPFFLYLPFAVPHLSIQVPDEEVEKYRQVIKEEKHKHRGYLKHPYPRAAYAAMVSYMDQGVGEIMELVKKLGLDDNTIILFSSDNGPATNRLGGSDSTFFDSANGFRGTKGSLYEGGIRIPLVARWPGKIKAGTVSDHQSAFWDILPTFCDLAEIKAPEGIDGISLAPTLLGQAQQQKQHAYLYWEFSSYGGQQALRMGKWKAIRQNLLKGKNPVIKTELYDLQADPAESVDLAEKHPELLKKLEQAMKDARRPSTIFPFRPLD
ncbi:MAG: arylsulfatase [Verrucomicrobiota bacterium]